jgi:alpha-tubulin suppressor-like RCC1 family protein
MWGSPGSDVVQAGLPPEVQSGTVLSISAGEDHALFLMSDGGVVSMGANKLGQVTVPTGASAGQDVNGVTATLYASFALKRRAARWWSGQ